MLKRIFKSLINQPFKTLLLLAVMFVLSLNLCTAFLIRSAGESTRNDALSGVNPLVAIKSNVCDGVLNDPLYADSFSFKSTEKAESEAFQYYNFLNDLAAKNNLLYADINMIIKSSPLAAADVDYGVLCQYHSDIDGTDVIETANYESLNNYLSGQADWISGFSLVSARESEFTDLHFGWSAIYEGRTFTDEEIDNGAMAAVIMKNNYSDNNKNNIAYYDGAAIEKLEIGDTLSFAIFEPGGAIYKTYDFKIIGFADVKNYKQPDRTREFYSAVVVPEKVFLEIYEDNMEVIAKYGLAANGDAEWGYLPHLSFFPTYWELNSLGDIDNLVKEIEDFNYTKNVDYSYETTSDQYTILAGDIESLSSGFTVMFIFSILVALILLTLIFALEINTRKNELAILVCMGESKFKVAWQLLGEYLIIAALSFVLALFSSHYLAKEISASMIDTNTLLENNTVTNIHNLLKRDITVGDIAESYQINLNLKEILILTFWQMSILFISVFGNVFYILRLKPKEVLVNE